MKKYLRYSCSVCKRTADRLVDNVRALPDKCTITFKCEGRLYPIEYRSDGGITAAPEVGITDWRARGAQIVVSPIEEPVTFLDTSTGHLQQIVLAVRGEFPEDAELQIQLKQRVDSPKNFNSYVYRMNSTFATVSGIEAGLEKKTLRYSENDVVEVFLNGVKQEPGEPGVGTYQVFDNVSQAPPNTILFNPSISLPGTTQVDIVVSSSTPTSTVELTLKRNTEDESRTGLGAWENVDYVQRFQGTSWTKWSLFTLDLDDASQLTLNTIMSAGSGASVNGSIDIALQDIAILLARKPYSRLDRYANILVPFKTLSFERDFLKYFVSGGRGTLQITASAAEAIYPPLKINKFSIEKTIQKHIAGISDQIVVDGGVIVGPDL